MASYKVISGRSITESQYAIGANTGSLFIMVPALSWVKLGYSTAIVLVGRGELSGKEGYRHEAPTQFFIPVISGTVLEIIT